MLAGKLSGEDFFFVLLITFQENMNGQLLDKS